MDDKEFEHTKDSFSHNKRKKYYIPTPKIEEKIFVRGDGLVEAFIDSVLTDKIDTIFWKESGPWVEGTIVLNGFRNNLKEIAEADEDCSDGVWLFWTGVPFTISVIAEETSKTKSDKILRRNYVLYKCKTVNFSELEVGEKENDVQLLVAFAGYTDDGIESKAFPEA